jgi:hypothetical protein
MLSGAHAARSAVQESDRQELGRARGVANENGHPKTDAPFNTSAAEQLSGAAK